MVFWIEIQIRSIFKTYRAYRCDREDGSETNPAFYITGLGVGVTRKDYVPSKMLRTLASALSDSKEIFLYGLVYDEVWI